MKITAEPRSDQWNADDFMGGSSKTFTVAGVKDGSAEQKYDITLEGESRVWRPPVTTVRILMDAWGDESDVWVGRRVTMFRDPSVRFGKDAVGGIRISHLSHLPGGKPLTLAVTSARGKRPMVTIQPLPDVKSPAKPANNSPEPTQPTCPEVIACIDVDALRAMWRISGAEIRALIQARIAELPAPATDPEPAPTDDAEPSDADWDLINAGGAL